MTHSEYYVHGYSQRECIRLFDQARTLSALLHCDVFYPPGSKVLEAGCGTGAQTVTLAKNNPQVSITCMDVSSKSLEQARETITAAKIDNVEFVQADIFDMPYEETCFDHVFLCFVLEHLPDPIRALEALMFVLKPGGSMTAIEGDHGSAYFYPDSCCARRAIQCLIDLQATAGGDALIGRRLYPLMREAGLRGVKVGPRVMYADAGRPELVEGFTRNTFAAMVEGVEQKVMQAEMMSPRDWKQGIADLYRTAEEDGTFSYTFFRATGIK